MTIGGSGFGVLEFKHPDSSFSRLAYLSPVRGNARVPSEMDNRRWEFYEIWNQDVWDRIEDPWHDGSLEFGLILANAAKRLVLARIIKDPVGQLHRYTYNLTGTQLTFPDVDEQVRINNRTVGKQLFFDTGNDDRLECARDWEPTMMDGKTVTVLVDSQVIKEFHGRDLGV